MVSLSFFATRPAEQSLSLEHRFVVHESKPTSNIHGPRSQRILNTCYEQHHNAGAYTGQKHFWHHIPNNMLKISPEGLHNGPSELDSSALSARTRLFLGGPMQFTQHNSKRVNQVCEET